MTRRTSDPHPPALPIILIVRGGVAHVVFKPVGISLAIYDYDWQAAAPDDPCLSRDPEGHACLYQEYGPSQSIVEKTRWPVIRKAQFGSYARSWKCPKCGQAVSCSYEDLAEAGVPICTDCDVQMDLQ